MQDGRIVSLIVALFIFISSVCVRCVCPNADAIKPCTCDDEGLQCMQLNNTQLRHVFSAPAQRKAIRRVWILKTDLTELKNASFGEYIIRDLYLDLNKIVRVSRGAFGSAAQTLQSLSLARNELQTFPFDDLADLKRLKQLGLGYNKLTEIGQDAFPRLDALESLDLSNNQIVDIEPFAFCRLHETDFIDLSRNHLTKLERNSLTVHSSGRHLAISLRANLIHTIAPGAFGNHHPHAIDLSHNQLTRLDPQVFVSLLLNDTIIDVDDNPFKCLECHELNWLLYLDQNHRDNLQNYACVDDDKRVNLTSLRDRCAAS